MIPGPRSPRKQQIYLHLERKQKTPGQHHRHPLHGRRRRSLERPSNRKMPMRGSLWPHHPPHPATHTAPQLRVPIVGTRRSFPSPTMTPFLSEKKLTTSRGRPGVGAPRVREGSGLRGPASRRRTDPLGPLPHVPFRDAEPQVERTPLPAAGTGEPGGGDGRRHSPRARRAPTAALPNRERGRRAGATAGDGGSGAEAPNSGPWRAYHGGPPHSSAGPGDSLKEP